MFPILRLAFGVDSCFLSGTRRDHHIVACCYSFLFFVFSFLPFSTTHGAYVPHAYTIVCCVILVSEAGKMKRYAFLSCFLWHACMFHSWWLGCRLSLGNLILALLEG